MPPFLVILCVFLVISGSRIALADLQFVDEVFKVVQFTDLHLGEGQRTDELTIEV